MGWGRGSGYTGQLGQFLFNGGSTGTCLKLGDVAGTGCLGGSLDRVTTGVDQPYDTITSHEV